VSDRLQRLEGKIQAVGVGVAVSDWLCAAVCMELQTNFDDITPLVKYIKYILEIIREPR
jgi:hypothetical protein